MKRFKSINRALRRGLLKVVSTVNGPQLFRKTNSGKWVKY